MRSSDKRRQIWWGERGMCPHTEERALYMADDWYSTPGRCWDHALYRISRCGGIAYMRCSTRDSCLNEVLCDFNRKCWATAAVTQCLSYRCGKIESSVSDEEANIHVLFKIIYLILASCFFFFSFQRLISPVPQGKYPPWVMFLMFLPELSSGR